ncbi:hypothetical protein B296_00007407 [Ensete ventricosum]|uniref:Uncharacterized protein n=1 Tax=Ensete ventricosum TaxID=4639 RepID=A0A427AX62_ENSVE|nr:hypothetical protein B296_00007407 [Ensete ventricosum]
MRELEFRSIFRAPSRKFKILAIRNLLAMGSHTSMVHATVIKSHAKSSFDRFFVHRLRNSKYWPFPTYYAHGNSYEHVTRKIEFRSIFRAPSRKFKILVIPNLLAHVKSYKHDFAKTCDGQKVTREVEFRSVFRALSRKYWPFPMY